MTHTIHPTILKTISQAVASENGPQAAITTWLQKNMIILNAPIVFNIFLANVGARSRHLLDVNAIAILLRFIIN